MKSKPPRLRALIVLTAALGGGAHAAEQRPGLSPCRLEGVEHEALCGTLRRPLDPAAPQGTQIDIRYAVLPALARNRKPDPVVLFAGGPGQSAIALAGAASRLFARLGNRRDVVLVDQRGTGLSAPLKCPEERPSQPLAETADPARTEVRIRECRQALQKLPWGDLRQYPTWIAVQDVDAVRRALAVPQINLVGGSYGTRAALEYMRQFPQAVRRVVIDGVAPPDMVLPAAFSTDNQAALDALLAACEGEAACRRRFPVLRDDWHRLLAGLPVQVGVAHPLTGAFERLTVTREMVLGLVRSPLYGPAFAAALPQAIHDATEGRFGALLALAGGVAPGRAARLFEGMHFAVVCTEDLPRLAQATDPPGTDYGDTFVAQYRRYCEGWPRGAVPAAFFTLPPAPVPTLLLSGGMDPVTPPRHAERAARALGGKARHVVVPQAGHGVMGLGCMRDVLFRFIDADTDDAAMKVDADCARAIPRPPVFVPVLAGSDK